MIKLGVPAKGRLMQNTFDWFANRNVLLSKSGSDREYIGKVSGVTGVELILLSAGEIPGELAAGRIDLGVTGTDLVHEKLANWSKKITPPWEEGWAFFWVGVWCVFFGPLPLPSLVPLPLPSLFYMPASCTPMPAAEHGKGMGDRRVRGRAWYNSREPGQKKRHNANCESKQALWKLSCTNSFRMYVQHRIDNTNNTNNKSISAATPPPQYNFTQQPFIIVDEGP